MEGDERVRFCPRCDRHVHDLSVLTPAETRAVLAVPSVCVRIAVVAAAAILTAACGTNDAPSPPPAPTPVPSASASAAHKYTMGCACKLGDPLCSCL